MTSPFQKFEYRELVANESAPQKSNAQEFQQTKFQHKQDAAANAAIHRKGDHFQLDSNVSAHLGIEERDRQAIESRVQKEIERRWEQMAEKAEVEGYTKGLTEGKGEAYKAELPRIKERLEKLEHILQLFDSFQEKIFQANEVFLMDLIAQVAGMVVLKEVELDKDYIRRVVVALIQQLGNKDDLKISLSEADIANVENLKQVLEKEFGKLNHTTIESSPEITTGGCKIETKYGVVDASLTMQIDNVMKALKG